ncbi:MAG: 3'(2'),5'-bisphosphate nucleotidase CysQ [Pseudomonadota bacterium]
MTDLAAVARITAEAGALALRRWDEGFASWEKVPGHPVCAVDLEVDALLRERLSALDPDAGWLSEETVDEPARLAAKRVWVVDPIDGTRDYIRRRIGWCVSVALVEDGRPVLAVLSAPARDELWMAEAGRGARCNGRLLHCGARTNLAGARAPTDSLPREDRDLVVVAKPNSIALRIAMVAADEADLLATIRWGNEWDIAAAVLIAAEAGCAVSNAVGAPLAFNQPDPQAFGVVASVPGIHAAAIARLAERAARVMR